MSHRNVQVIIGTILTDEETRRKFLAKPRETLQKILDSGFELTEHEFEGILRTDQRLWRAGEKYVHGSLQRCALQRTEK